MTTVKWNADYRGMVKVDKYLANFMDDKMKYIAQAVIDEVRGRWSPSSPSAGGSAPAKDTGAYDASLASPKAVQQGRDEWGRFTSVYTARFNTDEAERPRQYAKALEDGTRHMEARPHIAPAIERVKGRGAYLLR